MDPAPTTAILKKSARPAADFANSAKVWLGLVAFLILVELFITFVGAGLERDPRVALFSWPSIAVFALVGLAGVWLSHRTGFPAAWDPRISNRQRLLYPALIGLGFGLLVVARDQFTHGIELFLAQTGLATFNAPFPGSLLFYAGGAIIVEVVYRLLPIPLLLWLISNLILHGRAQAQVFWVLALLSSAIEPLTQDLAILRAATPLVFAAHLVPDYALNFTQAVMFRRYGFFASLVVRWAMYLVWHIGYGNLICRC
jgi:hypothetical protein